MMAFIYEIQTGKLLDPTGALIAIGYSGKGEHKNQPGATSLHNEGPIPAGTYRIGPPTDTVTHGPFVLPLTPDPDNLMWGRAGFLMHGDSVTEPGTASEGCIIMPRMIREQVAADLDHTLQVVTQIAEVAVT